MTAWFFECYIKSDLTPQTIDSKEATRVAEQIKLKILIPMHFKTEKCGFPIMAVGDFLERKTNAKKAKSSETTFDKTNLPQQMGDPGFGACPLKGKEGHHLKSLLLRESISSGVQILMVMRRGIMLEGI